LGWKTVKTLKFKYRFKIGSFISSLARYQFQHPKDLPTDEENLRNLPPV